MHTAFCNPYFGRIFMSKEDQGDMGSSTVFLIENQWTQKKVIFSNPPFFYIIIKLTWVSGCPKKGHLIAKRHKNTFSFHR